jgi:hypothetical protein
MKAIITNESKEQKALNDFLNEEIDNKIYLKDIHIASAEILQALVDKSIPKKVNGMINDWACANCDSDRGIIEEKPYCAVCGQKLDWSDNNE